VDAQGEKVKQMTNRKRLSAFFFAVLLTVGFLPQVARTDDPQVTLEKRSCIQAVDGYSYISEEKTVAELRSAALNNAKQQALGNAKTYIRSKTEVENFVLKSDEVLINAEGTVTILEQKDYGIVDNSRYHIWIKAEVEYQLGDGGSVVGKSSGGGGGGTQASPETGDVVPVSLPPPGAPLTVKIWSPKKEYREGEKIEIFLQGNRDFYARIVDVNAQGEIVQLLPNSYRNSSFFQGGQIYKIPDQSDQFDLTVSPPFGKDTIIVYASEVPLGEVALTAVGQGLGAYSGDRVSLAAATRGIAVTGKKAGAGEQPVALFYEAGYEIRTGR